MAKTAAEIPAETNMAQRSEYDANVLLGLIKPHPKNIRRKAVADDELVASIESQGLLQPLVVVPHGTTQDGKPFGAAAPSLANQTYLLIAGHRRLDGLKKAGFTHAPVIIRHDLTNEGDQIAAMLVENGRRTDLTALEEAEGYGQLKFDYGWKPGAIAKMSGHTAETINKRLKLLKLDDGIKTKVDKGQLNLEDAAAIADLPAAEQARVARTINGGYSSVKFELAQARERVKLGAEADKLGADLKAQGIEQRRMPATKSRYNLNDADDGMTPLGQTFSAEPSDHDGCLAFIDDNNGHRREIVYVCTDVARHDDQLDDVRRAKRLEEERLQREYDAHHAALEIARNLRLDAVIDSIKPGIKIDPALARIVKVLVGYRLRQLDTAALTYYFDRAGLADEQRWSTGVWNRKKVDVERFEAHLQAILDGPAYGILRTLIEIDLVHLETWAVNSVNHDAKSTEAWTHANVNQVAAYLGMTFEAGHEPTPIDDEILATIAGTEEAES
ncbi:hypothetical protein Back2_17620 [Nocardioides baekrokdamisoli]|uniref:ParB-like N-terminal domain-containing protein n=1 Tax=Nocardioides baekrokdamisoli TaxID=1804624 RepID=A0A3G9IN68_9ACTN|nr:ParB/RepB/Spo0J family partition protein [Nocardioides baekrokdamisoli]BBH17475.1 hypothetical protein Back2_17620 [Nocardioides baekrokdamisoli]